jgi:hypothetical protein
MILPGVGPAGAQALYAALWDWKRFKDGAHAASYPGFESEGNAPCSHSRISPLRIAFDFPDDKGDCPERSSRPLVLFP